MRNPLTVALRSIFGLKPAFHWLRRRVVGAIRKESPVREPSTSIIPDRPKEEPQRSIWKLNRQGLGLLSGRKSESVPPAYDVPTLDEAVADSPIDAAISVSKPAVVDTPVFTTSVPPLAYDPAVPSVPIGPAEGPTEGPIELPGARTLTTADREAIAKALLNLYRALAVVRLSHATLPGYLKIGHRHVR